jgi:ureidoglycolate hydrolase
VIEKVTATVAEETTDLKESNSVYTGELTAPMDSGSYPVTVSAYDDSGNVTVNTSTVAEVTLWHTPKTNWKATDRFNYVDYNRIKNNLTYLHDLAQEVYKQFSIVDMGADIEDYTGWFTAAAFNNFESNLETINKNIFTQNYGVSQRFFDNGQFIKWDELNRIESATLQMNDLLERQKAALRKLPFRLGAFREVRI